MMTFKIGERVLQRKSGVEGVVLTPAYEKAPYVEVDFGTHTGWCYPHELIPVEAEAEAVISLDTIPQYAKDVLYGYREGARAEKAKHSRGFADVFTEAQNERRAALRDSVANVIYNIPANPVLETRRAAADRIIRLVREAYPDPVNPVNSLPENLPVELEEDELLFCHICGDPVYKAITGTYRHKGLLEGVHKHDPVLTRPMPAYGSIVLWGNKPWTQAVKDSVFFSLPLAPPNSYIRKNATAHWDEMRGATYIYDAAEEYS